MPPIYELTRIEPAHIERLDHQGIFTTGLLLESSETPTRRQTLADQVGADTTDVMMWRDEALMLNLAGFGPAEHQLMIQAGIGGLRDILDLELGTFRERVRRAAAELGAAAPTDIALEAWWDQARTLQDEANPAAVGSVAVPTRSEEFASGRRWLAAILAGIGTWFGVVALAYPFLSLLLVNTSVIQAVGSVLGFVVGTLVAGIILRVRGVGQWTVIGVLVFGVGAGALLALVNTATLLRQ